jgi:hypothetical protein
MSWRLKRAGHTPPMGEKNSPYRILAGKPEGKRLLGRPRHRWEDIIKIVIKWDERA